MVKLGSLFDGSGGFPLAGSLCNFEPVWASEVEPYPIAVTKSRFPKMKHLGDISKINGAEIEPVDIITFGSPCQDLSVAGKRAGLKHEDNGDEETTRSGLFMEAIRIIKEMRDATNGEYPRFAVWENVPGAFSSNKGEDFRIVLEEFVKIIEPTAVVPPVPKAGWAYADVWCGDKWSLAYRVFDAQYWGVPQRRRRIYLVADFRGKCAGKILFERKGLRGYSAESRTQGQEVAGDVEGCAGAAGGAKCYGIDHVITTGGNCTAQGACYYEDIQATLKAGGIHAVCYTLWQENKSATIATNNDQYLFQPVPNILLDDQGGSQISVRDDGKCPTLRAETHGNLPCVMEQHLFEKHSQDAVVEPIYCLQGNGIDRADTAGCNGKGWNDKTCYTLNTIDRPAVVYAIDQQGGKGGANYAEDIVPTLCSDSHGTPHAVAYAMQGFGDYKESDVASGLKARDYKDATDLAITGDVSKTLNAAATDSDQVPCCIQPICGVTSGAQFTGKFTNKAETLRARDYKEPQAVAYECFRQGGFADFVGGEVGTLRAAGGDYGGGSENLIVENSIRYIVRRLTPTECARLQGFPDRWGDIDHKEDLTEEEYRFWLEVRNTHAAINGKQVKEHTKAQMLTWYNKLHTDSSEYKLWGNGIALPCALYVMQGIQDVLEGKR